MANERLFQRHLARRLVEHQTAHIPSPLFAADMLCCRSSTQYLSLGILIQQDINCLTPFGSPHMMKLVQIDPGETQLR